MFKLKVQISETILVQGKKSVIVTDKNTNTRRQRSEKMECKREQWNDLYAGIFLMQRDAKIQYCNVASGTLTVIQKNKKVLPTATL